MAYKLTGRLLGTTTVETDDGYVRKIHVIDKVNMPKGLKGFTDKLNYVAISKHLKDLKEKKNVKHPKAYVFLHEIEHVKHPGYSERQVRESADSIYNGIFKENISTVDYFRLGEKAESGLSGY